MSELVKLEKQRESLVEKIIAQRNKVGLYDSFNDQQTRSLETRIFNLDKKIDHILRELVNTTEVAKMLNVSKTTIYYY